MAINPKKLREYLTQRDVQQALAQADITIDPSLGDKDLVAEWESNLSFVLDESLKEALSSLQPVPSLSDRVVKRGYAPRSDEWSMPTDERVELLARLEERFKSVLEPLIERAEKINQLGQEFGQASPEEKERILTGIENLDAQMDYMWRPVFMDAKRAARKELANLIGRDHPERERLWELAETRMFPTEEMKQAQKLYRELKTALDKTKEASPDADETQSQHNPRNSL